MLRTAGYEVIVPGNQSCCGALHVHSGDRKTARSLALQHCQSFGQKKLDAIVTNAAGCGAQLKEIHLLFPVSEDNKFEVHDELEKKTTASIN